MKNSTQWWLPTIYIDQETGETWTGARSDLEFKRLGSHIEQRERRLEDGRAVVEKTTTVFVSNVRKKPEQKKLEL